nr:acyl-CoA dehydrogenase family protein [Actinomycetota bacterium]
MAGSSATLSSPFFTDVHRAMAEAVDTYLERLGGRRDELLRTILDQRRYPDELMEAMASLGVVGAMIPEEYGGSGAGLLAVAVAMERFSAYGLGNTLAMLTVMDGLAILRGGSESQRLKLLPAIAEGRLKLAFAITEPDAGTNSFNIGLRARRDGSAYRLTGEKAWITGVDRAD